MAMHSSSFPPNVPLNLAAHLGPAMVPIPKNVELAMRTIVTVCSTSPHDYRHLGVLNKHCFYARDTSH